MYTILILFFLSLAGIVFMLGRKLILIRRGELEITEEKILFELPGLEIIKEVTVKHTKKYGYIVLVIIIRIYVKSSNLLKKKYKEIEFKIKEKIQKYLLHKNTKSEEKDTSKFLKIVSEYKNKIRKIKHQIKEEENKIDRIE